MAPPPALVWVGAVTMPGMSESLKQQLHRYLQQGRDALLWKLDGVPEYDIRRPATLTGTNLLGLVKHAAIMELAYLGPVFERDHDIPQPWCAEDADPNADMWATAEESKDHIVGLYHRAWEHGDATIAALDLDGPGHVPWWGVQGSVTLGEILVHLIAETHRHAGHADILREQIDGAAGLNRGNENIPREDRPWWASYRHRLEEVAVQFRS